MWFSDYISSVKFWEIIQTAEFVVLPLKQSGLRTGYSCETALSDFTDDILRAADDSRFVDTYLYLNFFKLWLGMVINKSGLAAHPCIKEVTFVTARVTPLSTKFGSQRFSEPPSLRYGSLGSRNTMTGPLRISNNCQSSRYRSLSLERGKVKDEQTRPPRRVRFVLPPPDVSTSRLAENPENRAFSSRNTADSAGIFNINTEKHLSQRPNAKRIQLKEKYSESADEKFSLTRRFEKFRREHLQDRIRVFGESVEVPVSVSPGVRTRVHPTGRYIKGTLSPTSNQAPHEPPVSPGGQALLRAARDGDDQTLREQLRRALAVGIPEADLNATDSSGRTILSYVASNGTIDLLELILQIPGLDPNKPDNEGNTPLHFAAQAGQVECLNCLASRCRGVEIDARNNLGFTPLMKAALQGRNKCAKLLLFAGDHYSLQSALSKGNQELLKFTEHEETHLSLFRGANPTLRDNGRGFRADQWARFCGRYVCADVIEKHARQRLLERSTSYGSWGLEHEMGARVVMGKVVPIPPVAQPQSNGLRSRLKKVFRTSSGPSTDTFSSARLVTQLTSAALCASSPVLPNGGSVPPVVKSLIRPLTVPRLQITLVNNNGDYPNCNLENTDSNGTEKSDKVEKNDHVDKSVVSSHDNKVSSNGVMANGRHEVVKPTRTKKKK